MNEKGNKSKKKKFDERSFDEDEQIIINKETDNKKKKNSIKKEKEIGEMKLEFEEIIINKSDNNISSKNNFNPFTNASKTKSNDDDDDDEIQKNPLDNKIDEPPKIKMFYYINANKLTREDLKDGRRIFNNKTEISGYNKNSTNEESSNHFIEFRQLLFENLLLNEDMSENLKENWTMESAIFSTFCYDEEFIEPLIYKYKIKSLIIKHEDNKSIPIVEKDDLITFVHPKIDFSLKWGKFHSKLTIFKFPNFIRIIIPTANLTNGDWYFWGQIIWFQDFPIKKDNINSDHDFENYLQNVLDSSLPNNYKIKNWFKNLNINLSIYDYSDTVVDLVASSSGRFNGNNKNDWGVGRMKFLSKKYSEIRKSLNNCNSDSKSKKLIAQCSSVGKSLKDKFLNDLCHAFLCKNQNSNAKVDIIFPTTTYINSFLLGPQLSGCLFLNQDTFSTNKQKFKKFEMLPQHESNKTVFHSKFLISCNDDNLTEETITDNTIFYFGSHNLSIAAWGSFEKNDSQISISNFELGVVFNPIKLRFEEKKIILKSLLMNLNSDYYNDMDTAFIVENF